MKAIKLKFVPSHSLGRNTTMSDAYRGKCPFCADILCIWPSEYKDGSGPCHDSSNVCAHFDGIVNGKAVMRPKMSVVAHGNVMRVNGITLPYSMIELYNVVARIDDEIRPGEYYLFPSWAPGRRFYQIRDEIYRVHDKNVKKWKAQHASYLEGKERAEYARLKAKYEHA